MNFKRICWRLHASTPTPVLQGGARTTPGRQRTAPGCRVQTRASLEVPTFHGHICKLRAPAENLARTPMPHDKQLSRRKEPRLACTICTFPPGDHEHLLASHLLPTVVKERSSLLLTTERIFETMRKGTGPSQRGHLAP